MTSFLKITIGVLIAVGAVGAFGYYIFFRSPAQAPASNTGQYGGLNNNSTGVTSNTTPPQQGATIPLKLFDGTVIQVKDFKSSPTTVKDPINSGTYFLGYHPYEGVADPTANDDAPYFVQYDDKNQSFSVMLLQEPIAATRLQVEQYLADQLGIKGIVMCELVYTISVPKRVNSVYAGTNLGFSFCPGATKL